MSVKGQQATSDGSQSLICCEPEALPRLQRWVLGGASRSRRQASRLSPDAKTPA